jgi:dual specificity phosphatase 12
MLDHGQLGPATPARTPAPSRRPSAPATSQSNAISGSNAERLRRPSRFLADPLSLTMSTITQSPAEESAGKSDSTSPIQDPDPSSTSALEDGSDEDDSPRLPQGPTDTIDTVAKTLGRRMSEAIRTPPAANAQLTEGVPGPGDDAQSETAVITLPDLAAELNTNTKLATLRSSSFSKMVLPISAPILANPKCSGYFVEPVRIFYILSYRCDDNVSFLQSDEVDGALFGGGGPRWKDCLSELKMWCEVGEL